MTNTITLRPPCTTHLPQPPFTPPTTTWLSGKWHVTHSTLPMWKTKRNVTITYTPLPSSQTEKLDDIVSYQPLTSPKTKTVHGIDTPSSTATGAWEWRGKGWLMIASSHWEVLGYGEVEGGGQWAVTYFAKTMFTPAGIDVYSRAEGGLPREFLGEIKEALAGIEDVGVRQLAGVIFEVRRD